MPRRFLLGCYEVPGYGGASTVAYRLFQDLQAQGLEVAFVNLIGRDDAEPLRARYGETLGNPRALRNVHNVVLERAAYDPSPAHANVERLIRELAPDVVIGVGYIAALLLKASAPDKRIIFITTGCDQAKGAIASGRARTVGEILAGIEKRNASGKFHLPPAILNAAEAQAVARADLILVHSEMTRTLFLHYFPTHAVKVLPETLWLAEWIVQDAAEHRRFWKAFPERDIDVVVAASHWKRPEKNWRLARELILRYPEWKWHVLGDGAERAGNATYHGLVTDRDALYELLGRARVLASPSCFDTAPGVLFEAAVLGCNVVASKNCGNWQLCPPALLAATMRADEFGERIRRGRTREYRHNLDAFLQSSARRMLVEILDVFE